MYSLPVVYTLSLALSRGQLALAERLNVPSKWREPNIVLPFDKRATLASNALDVVVGMVDSDLTYQHDIVLTLNIVPLFSKFDSATNQTKYKNSTEQFFSRYTNSKQLERALGEDTYVDDNLMFGYAAILAYTTYKDGQYLSAAQDAWDFARRYTLLEEDIKNGTQILDLNYDRIHLTCNGESMAGGTTEIAGEDVFFGGETILFLRLSGLLYEATSNGTYLSAARESANFVQAHLSQSPGLIQEAISGDDCKFPPHSQSNFSDTSGILIHGLSLLSSSNSSLMSLIEQSVATVTNRTGVWQKDNGIQANDNDILENQGFIGGLGEAYERLASSDNLKNYTASFLAVQYNAVLELATEGQSNVYSGDWSGPPQSAPDVSSQAAASEVLIAGIRLGPGPNGSFTSTETSTTAEIETPTSAVSSQPSNPTVKSSTPTGAIIGGVIGGVALIVVITLMSWIYRRRRRQNATAPLPFNAEQDNGNDGVRSPVDSRGRKHQEAVSSLEQTNAPPRNSLPPIEDMVRALYEQYRSEAPPSYRPGTS